MTITAIDATNVRLDGKSRTKSSLTVNLVQGAYLEIIEKSTGKELLPLQKWDKITNGATGVKYASQDEFNAAVTSIFGIGPGGAAVATTAVAGLVKQAAASANTATSPSAAYTQSEAVALFNELRDLKTKLRASGALAN